MDFLSTILKNLKWVWCRKGDPFQGLRVGSCLILRNELFRETLMLTKQEHLLEKGRPGREQEGAGTQEDCAATGHSVRFRGDGDGCRVISGQSFWLRVLPRGTASVRMDSSEKDSGRLAEHMNWHLLSTFDLFWILLVGDGLFVSSSLPSCCRITRAAGYYGAWRGQGVLESPPKGF